MQPSELLRSFYDLYLKFSKSLCMESEACSSASISYLRDVGVVYDSIDGRVCVKSLVRFALELIRLGADVEVVSQQLTWRDFEELVSNYLEMNNYHVIRNLRFGTKKYEVDVLGVDEASAMAIVIDCKHWSPGYGKRGRLSGICREHRLKTEELSRYCPSLMGRYPRITKARYMVPVVITLTEAVRGFLNGSFIVPIHRFSDYIANIGYYIELIGGKSMLIRNECYVADPLYLRD